MDQTLSLRPANLDDIDALDRLFRRSYMRLLADDYPPSVLVTAVPVIGRAQPDLVASGRFYVVEGPTGLVGAGGWSLQPPGGRPGRRGVGHMRHVATDPDHTRQGVARLLLDHILMQARGSGMLQMRALSTLTAVPFYSAMGFVQQGETQITLRGGIAFPSVVMQAQL